MRAALQITANEAIIVHADIESGGASVFDRRRSVFLDQGKHSQDTADACLSFLLIDQMAKLADFGSSVFGAPQELRRGSAAFSLGGLLPGCDIRPVSGAGAREEVGWCWDAGCARAAHPTAL